jgi:hypothetical protein
MLDPNRDRRPKNYGELLNRIDSILGCCPTPTTVPLGLPAKKTKASRFRWWIGGSVIAVALVAALTAFVIMRNPRTDEPSLQPVKMRATGRIEALFDGQTLAGWQSLKGLWAPATDAENGSVLAGQSGVARHPLPDWTNYRLLVAANPHKSSAVELHFGLLHEPKAARYVLRVSPKEGVVAGRRSGDFGALETLTTPKPYPKAEDLAVRAPYLALRVDRQPGQWVVYFDGEPIGILPIAATDTIIPEFRLVAEGGPAHFEGLEVGELKPD